MSNTSQPDPRIAWHLKHSGVKSELAVMLAIAASERGNQASYEWEAYNAKRFQSVLEQRGVAKPANDQAQRLGAGRKGQA